MVQVLSGAEAVHEQKRIAEAIDSSASGAAATNILRSSIRAQVVALCEGEINAKSLGRIQRFCASAASALLALEKPEHLVRDRFGGGSVVALPGGGEYSVNPIVSPIQLQDATQDASVEPSVGLASAPIAETYGANVSRNLIAEATKLGKDVMRASFEGQVAARRTSSLPELVTSLVLAKKQRLGKKVIAAIEKQIEEASAPSDK